MKKILHISKFFYPYFGGIEDMALTIVQQMKSTSEQRVICFNHKKGTETEIIDGVEVLRVGAVCTLTSQPVSLKYKKLLQDQIDAFKPDFIHLHVPNPLVAYYLLSVNKYNARIITHWHADVLNKKWFYPFIQPIEQKLVAKSYKILCTSKIYSQNSVPLKEAADKITILQSIVDEKKLKVEESENREIERIQKQYNNKKIVFFFGRHVPYKGIEYLLEAEKQVKEDCVFVIAGTGNLTSKLKQAYQGNERIKFTGKLPNNELKYYLYASSLFAFPSINRSEAFGLALAEALYCGLPAVSFNIEGSGTLWVNKHNYSGLIVENKNAVEFGAAISKILSSDSLRQEMSKNAIEWVRSNFLKDNILPILQNIYI